MDSSLPALQPSGPVEPTPARAATLWGAGPLFERWIDRNALDRMLLELVVHAAGCERAHLLLWNPAHRMLEGRLAWSRTTASRPLADALTSARRQATEGTDPDGTRRLRALALLPEDMGAMLADTWARGDVAVGPAPDDPVLPWRPGDAIGVIGLKRGSAGYGLLVGEWPAPGDDVERRATLDVVRRLAEAALGAHADAEEARRSAHQAAAVAELARAGISPSNLAEVLQVMARLAAQGTAARGSAVWLADAAGVLELSSAHGPSGTRERMGHALQALAGQVFAAGSPRTIERVTDEPTLSPDAAAQLVAVALHPLVAYGQARGVLAVYDRAAFHPGDDPAFDVTDQRFLATLADAGALVVEHARRTAELAQVGRREADLKRHLAQREQLAALGEMAGRVAHETRNPLASIGAFARRVHRLLGAEDPNREYLEVVIREAERLERIMGEQAELATVTRPRLKVESLNQVVQHSLQGVGEQLVRRRVRLLKKLAPDLPPLLLDAERIRRVVDNILADALDNVAPGGRVRVESRRAQHHVVVEIANDGSRPPGELLSQLFVPFAAAGQPGAHVGLSMARQIVQQHGGEIRVRSEAEWSTIYSFTLPIRENKDRRQVNPDRRATRRDRRDPFPAA